jgi:hypothetical protein
MPLTISNVLMLCVEATLKISATIKLPAKVLVIRTPIHAAEFKIKLLFRAFRPFYSDLENKMIHCVNQVPGTDKKRYSLDYDTLVIAVGSYSNTFGIPGVKENACFLKDVQDARKIRKRLIECKINYNKKVKHNDNSWYDFFFLVMLGFEYASQPGLTDAQKSDRLHFVVVGAGPTVRSKKKPPRTLSLIIFCRASSFPPNFMISSQAMFRGCTLT